MPTVTPEPIIKVAMGFMAAKHLFVASEVGLFEALAAGPATIDELCEPDRCSVTDDRHHGRGDGQSRVD
jgi:hypothetical protein